MKIIFFTDSGHREENASPGGLLERWANMFDLTSANIGGIYHWKDIPKMFFFLCAVVL